jgi:hypothetical protein
MTNETSTLASFLFACEDLSNINISIAAVDRCERKGMNTANFTPSLLPTPQAPSEFIQLVQRASL